MSYLKDWPILNKVNVNKYAIQSFYVFGKLGDEVFIMTRDLNVYAFGRNSFGCLGVGDTQPVISPIIVNEFCGKEIIKFAHDFEDLDNYMLALTSDGEVYSWGINIYGTLGNGSLINSYRPSLIQTLKGLNIIDICCGYWHCMALSRTGEVHAWGSNKWGCVGSGGDRVPQCIPIRVTALNAHKVIAITCGSYHSLALAENGMLYSWGLNEFGQLGIASNEDRIRPVRVHYEEYEFIVKICGGRSHSLMLSLKGSVFYFGYNDKVMKNSRIPIRICLDEKIKDIFSISCSHIAIAITEDNKCYFWGVDGHVNPIKIIIKSIRDAFCHYYGKKVTLFPLKLDRNNLYSSDYMSNTIPLSQYLNNRNTSDIRFKVKDKFIYAHKTYLRRCSPYLNKLIQALSSRPLFDEIKIEYYSHTVFYAYLEYLYTGSVHIEKGELLCLINLADCYNENDLMKECIQLFKNTINYTNVCDIFCLAIKYKFKELEDYCADFAIKNKKEICNTDGYKNMDCNSLQKFLLTRKID